MPSVQNKWKTFRQAVNDSRTYPAAASVAHRLLPRLLEETKRSSSRIPVLKLEALRTMLPEPVETTVCPACQGSGKQGRFLSSTHACGRCGGWKVVERTQETMREMAWIWSATAAAA